MSEIVPEVDLPKAIETELKTLVGDRGIVQQRMMPLVEREELEQLHVTPYFDGGGLEEDLRGTDDEEIIVGIAIQKAVPHAESNDRGISVFDGIDNLPFAREMFALSREIKSLWQPEGSLRDTPLAGCVFRRIDQDNLFEPTHLLSKGVLSIVIGVTYGHTLLDDEE